MKQKSGGIKRLMEFTGKHRGLLTVSRILSGISSVFILGPFLCVYFAARDLVGVFAGTPLDTNSLVRWGLLALGLELIGLVLYFSALLCSHVVAFHTEKTLKMAALKHLAKMPMGYFDANPSGKLRKIIDDNSFQTETFIAHQLPDLVGAQVTMIVSLVLMLVFDWRVGIPLLLLFGIGFFLQGSLMGKDSMKFMQTYQDSLETMNHEAVEYIRGISVVKVFGQTVQSITKFIIVFLTQWLQYNKTYTVAYKESANRRIVLAEKLRKLPLSFFGQRDLSDLTTTIMGDCTALERVFSNAIPQLFGTIFMFIITAIGLLVLDWRMGLCIVVPVPVAALVVFAAKKAQSNAESANMDAKRAAYDGVQEYLDTIQELKSCSREEEYLEGLEKKLDYVVKCSFRNEIAPGAATTTAQFILRFGLVAVMLVGGILVTAGSLSIPMFILFLLFAGRIYDPFTSCFMLMAEVFSALVSVKRMKQIDATPEQTGTNVCNNKGYDIEFKNVVFSYNEEPVLKGVSFVAKQGEVTALVGPSGSGKSTASKLAARFWDADSGTITLGGVDVKTVEPETLFKNYAIVFQDVMLFDETVMENIRLGRGDATDEEVMAAARAAQCEEFIQRLPQGYQTNIGENGSALSGGERQRISIARALLKNAPIVLLDEATASMDAESETLIQDALSVLLKDKTVMVIAHRMRTVANADKIVVLDDGKVSEMGTPAELMKKGGLYAHLVELQQGK